MVSLAKWLPAGSRSHSGIAGAFGWITKKQDQQEFVFILYRRKLYNETDASMNEWKLRKGMLLTQTVVSLRPHIMNYIMTETMTGHFVNSTMCAMSSGWRGEVFMYLDEIHLWEQFVHLLSLALSERNNSKEMWELSVCSSKKWVTGISTSQCLQWNASEWLTFWRACGEIVRNLTLTFRLRSMWIKMSVNSSLCVEHDDNKVPGFLFVCLQLEIS